MRILIIHGCNLNMTGIREKEVYGTQTLDDINKNIIDKAKTLGIAVEIYHSNSEGSIIDKIHGAYKKFDGIIINPGAYTHYSIAIRDAIVSVQILTVEVHLSNIYKREEFRHNSVIAPACMGQIAGFGVDSYILAMKAIKNSIGTQL